MIVLVTYRTKRWRTFSNLEGLSTVSVKVEHQQDDVTAAFNRYMAERHKHEAMPYEFEIVAKRVTSQDYSAANGR